ncbi:PilN domain-containing protein [Zoogloea sp.]|uniref:PilN domain-containing protein n=1 Tax=Zoogloea sp. TaxID=49181 RepID=UPI0035B100E3
MSRLWPERIRLHIGPASLRVSRRGRADLELPLAADWSASLAALPELPRHAHLEVRVADCHARYFRVLWPAGLLRGERDSWLRHRFAEIFGSVDGWRVLADRDAVVHPCLALALPMALVAAVDDLVEQRGLKLRSLSTDFVESYNPLSRRLAADGALARACDGRLTLGLWQDGRWLAIRSLTGVGVEESLAGLLPQLVGRGELPAGGTLYLAGATDIAGLPAGWKAEAVDGPSSTRRFGLRRAPPPLALDFAGQGRRLGWVGALMLATGVAALAGVMHEYAVLENQRDEALRWVERFRRAIDRQAGLRPAAGVVSEQELRPALGVARLLRRDWPGVFAALEGAADDPGIAVLGVDLEGPRGTVKLVGEARNLPEVFAFARRLEGAGGLAEVRLVSYAFQASASVPSVGFTLAARWEGKP